MTLLLLTAGCSTPDDRPPPPPLASEARSAASDVVAALPTSSATGPVFARSTDRKVVQGFVDGAARLFQGDTRPHPEQCDPVIRDLSLAAPPEDLMLAAGRIGDPTLRMLTLGARQKVGQLLSECAGGRDVPTDDWDAARDAVAFLTAALEENGDRR